MTPGMCSAAVMRVAADRARRAFADIFLRSAGSRPIGRSMRLPGLDDAPHERDVFLFDLAVVELPRELGVRAVVLGDHHQARRAAIEAMHDARPQLAADAAEVVHLVQQRVDERALRVARGGMDDHAGRFVDDDQIRILIDDVEVEVFGLRRRRCVGSGISMAIASPARTMRLAGTAWPAMVTLPSLMRR